MKMPILKTGKRALSGRPRPAPSSSVYTVPNVLVLFVNDKVERRRNTAAICRHRALTVHFIFEIIFALLWQTLLSSIYTLSG